MRSYLPRVPRFLTGDEVNLTNSAATLVLGTGVEPASCGFSDRRSDRLSYPSINEVFRVSAHSHALTLPIVPIAIWDNDL